MANRILYERGMWDKVRIDEVEFIEQYEDIATHAAHVVKDLRNHLRIALGEQEDLQTAERLQIVEGGLLQRPVSEYAKGWWRRLQITATEAGSGSGTSALQFVLLTDRARAEESSGADAAGLGRQAGGANHRQSLCRDPSGYLVRAADAEHAQGPGVRDGGSSARVRP